MPSAPATRNDEPAHSDRLIAGASELIGGPLGDHAVRSPGGGSGSRVLTPVRVVLALIFLTMAVHWVQKSPCRDGQWTNLSQYKYMCYTDVLALYYAEKLSEGAVPYKDHPVEYPVLTGAFMGAIGLPVHDVAQRFPGMNQAQVFYDLNALVLGAFAVATAAALLALRRRRPWDAALFAVAPAIFVSGTVNWDMFVIGLTALFMVAWARRKPVLAGVLLGLAVAAKFYPLVLLGPLLLLALRSGRWRAALTTTGLAAATWLAINLPVALSWREGWLRFFQLNSERGIDWGTFWYIGAHLPMGRGKYGLSWFTALDAEPGHSTLNALYLGLFVVACGAIAALALLAKRRPRFAQLAFLVVAAFLVVGKVWSQQYVLWLIPLAVLARPKWGAFLAWQLAELAYFVAFYGELMGASGRNVFPEWVFVFASSARLITVCVLMGYVVSEILRPERDAVRRTYDDDPDGGEFDGAPDTGIVARLRSMVLRPVPPGAGASASTGAEAGAPDQRIVNTTA
ncbi:MAG TPA: glycosyltransferase 87 family protein [Micromonosporaceae bacterium]|nr:glycosyltransferase 87 family protein [Micromonosporaceae bacterium]